MGAAGGGAGLRDRGRAVGTGLSLNLPEDARGNKS